MLDMAAWTLSGGSWLARHTLMSSSMDRAPDRSASAARKASAAVRNLAWRWCEPPEARPLPAVALVGGLRRLASGEHAPALLRSPPHAAQRPTSLRGRRLGLPGAGRRGCCGFAAGAAPLRCPTATCAVAALLAAADLLGRGGLAAPERVFSSADRAAAARRRSCPRPCPTATSPAEALSPRRPVLAGSVLGSDVKKAILFSPLFLNSKTKTGTARGIHI